MARPGLDRHPKFCNLVRMLQEPRPHVRGYLDLLWEACYESGNPVVGNPAMIEATAEYPGEPGKLFAALSTCGGEARAGLIEQNEDGEWLVHDLYDHAPEYVQRRMQREAERVARGVTISQLRAEAGRKGGQAKAKQTEATDGDLLTGPKQTEANGATPTPAPTPAPTLKKTLLVKDPEPPQNDGTGKKPPKPPQKMQYEPEDSDLAKYIFSRVQDVVPGANPPAYGKWANEIRLMRERDGHAPGLIREVFDWANRDDFWRTNILSPSKLRKQFPALLAKMRSNANANRPGPAQEHDPDRPCKAL